MNGTAHIGNGNVIPNSVIGIKDGKIVLIGNAIVSRIKQGEYDTTINCYGKHVYPGQVSPKHIPKIVGTLEAGKDATLFISESDISKVILAFVKGRMTGQ